MQWLPDASLAEKVRFVHQLLKRYRFSVDNEKRTQADIENVLTRAQVPFVRECNLGDAGVIDFMIDDTIGIEVKIKGSKMSMYRQCKRYCETGRFQHLILATLTAITLPADIDGTPTSVASLSTAFLC